MNSKNEYISAAGDRYVAKQQEGCPGCAHFVENVLATVGCREAAECRPRLRTDGLSIIWIKSEDGGHA